MKIDFNEDQKAWIRKVTQIDPEADLTDDDLLALIEALSDDLQCNGLTDDDENERGRRDAELLTWLARNS